MDINREVNDDKIRYRYSRVGDANMKQYEKEAVEMIE